MYKITKFTSKKTSGKRAISPYDDLTFDFETLNINTKEDLFRVLVNEFVLNITLDLQEPLRTFRRKANLNSYYPKKVDYVIIDADHVKTKQDQVEILKYFKKYNCILGESRSCNNVDNFNIKGFLFIEPLEIKYLKSLLAKLQDDLSKFCELDPSPARKAALNAPINKYKILLNSDEDNYNYSFSPVQEIVFKNSFEIPKDLDVSNVDTIQKLCLKVFESLGFEALKVADNCITFKHPTEIKSPGGFFWFYDNPYVMRHYNSTRDINLFDQISKLQKAKELLKKEVNYETELLNYNTNTNLTEINQQFIEVDENIKSKISEFLEKPEGLFSIRSPMGTAKSKIIEEIIKQAQDQDMKVLICSNRISVAQDYSKKYNIKLYNRDNYNIGDSLIVQYDSLHKYNIRMFDIAILDEFVSVMIHSRSNLNNTNINLSKLFACLRKKLVIADAFLTGFENRLLTCKKDNIFLVQNNFRDSAQLYDYENYNCFIQSILIHAKKHKKITISCTSLNIIKALKKLLSKYGLRVITLTAETPKVTKELIFKCFEKSENDKFDVLIYSPTLTVGISNLNNVDYHFHYDSANTCDVISSLQMIKRTRKAKEIHFYIKNKINYVKTTLEEIRDSYLKNLGNQLEMNFLFELNNYGEPRLSKLGKNALQIDLFKNILEFNHKNAFLFLLQYQFKNKPIKVTQKFETNILLPYIKEVQKENYNLTLELLEEYYNISNIDISDIKDSENSKIFEILYNLEFNIDTSDKNIRKEILKLEIEHQGFIKKCKNYNLIKDYSNTLDKSQIQIEISNDIINNVENVKFWNDVLKIIKRPLKDKYYPCEISDKFKNILKECGFENKSKIGERFLGLNDNIEKYKDFIKF